MIKTSRFSYGASAAVVTSTALITGLSAANTTRTVILTALLIAALADNLTDALSVHIFQESEQLDQTDAFTGTVTNFFTRLLLCISFAPAVAWFPVAHVAEGAILWGAVLLAILTYLVARERKVSPALEVVKHLMTASAVIAMSMLIGHWIGTLLA